MWGKKGSLVREALRGGKLARALAYQKDMGRLFHHAPGNCNRVLVAIEARDCPRAVRRSVHQRCIQREASTRVGHSTVADISQSCIRLSRH